jgi:hypothetical protein
MVGGFAAGEAVARARSATWLDGISGGADADAGDAMRCLAPKHLMRREK